MGQFIYTFFSPTSKEKCLFLAFRFCFPISFVFFPMQFLLDFVIKKQFWLFHCYKKSESLWQKYLCVIYFFFCSVVDHIHLKLAYVEAELARPRQLERSFPWPQGWWALLVAAEEAASATPTWEVGTCLERCGRQGNTFYFFNVILLL